MPGLLQEVIAVVFIVVVAAGLAYLKGRHDATASQKAAAAVQGARYDEVATRLHAALSDLERQAYTRSRVVARIVQAPVYRRACLDDAGMRAANAALATPSTAAALPATVKTH